MKISFWMFQKLRQRFIIGVIGVLLTNAVYAQTMITDEKMLVATVNGIPITIPQYEWLLGELTKKNNKSPEDPYIRSLVREELVRRAVVESAARKTNLLNDPRLRAHIELAIQDIVNEAYFAEYFKQNPITEQEISKEYEDWALDIGKQEFKIKQILVVTETEAKSIIRQLALGGNFGKIASRVSQDQKSRANEGDMGWVNKLDLDVLLYDALQRLRSGEYTATPLKTDLGWHILYLENIRLLVLPPLWEAKERLKSRLRARAEAKALNTLRRQSKVVINPKF